jgi:hypothetical protein
MSKRLTYRTVPVASLDAPTRARMLALMEQCYEGVAASRFFTDLDDKQFVILLHDPDRGVLAGFSTIALRRVEDRGRTAEVLYSGDTVIHPDYWGQKMLDTAFARFLLWRKLRRPFSPFYWLLLSAGYKTYLIILRYFAGAFPRRGLTPDPADEAFLADLCRRWFAEGYDAARGIVRMSGHYKVREGVAPVDAQALADPDIAFFHQRNPGHVQGDELVCLAQVRLSELGRAFVRIFTRRLTRRRRHRPLEAPGQPVSVKPELGA